MCMNKWKRHALVVVAFDDFEKIDTQNLKHHDEVLAVRAMMQKAV